MRFAVFSDIHGNIFALEKCMEHIEKNNIDAIIWCGDYITDIPKSHEIINYIKKINEKYTNYMIRGNRENYIIEYHKSKNKDWNIDSRKGALLCTYNELSNDDIEFIESLPETYTINIPELPKIFISHKRNYNDGNDCEYKIFGHSHKQYLFSRDNIKYINPGSIGLATGGQVGAEFTILDINKNQIKIENCLIKYNINEVIELIKQSKLNFIAVKWGNALIKLIQTGMDYPDMYIKEVLKIAKEHGINEDLDTIPIEIWNEARKSLNI